MVGILKDGISTLPIRRRKIAKKEKMQKSDLTNLLT